MPVTLQLGLMAIVIGLVIALPIGIYSAIRQDTAADYVGRSVAIIGLATPNFWLGTMIMIFPAIWWGWSPAIELIRLTEDPLGSLGVFIIPSLILGTYLSAATMRITRTMMLEVLRQDYIRTAWAKGLKERVVVVRHAVKNALIPVVTLVGLQLPILVGGSVIMENIFNLPGLGRLMLTALTDRDYPVLTFMSIVGKGVPQLILVLGISGGIGGSRLVRSAVIDIKENTYFQATRVIGASKWRTFTHHVLPNIMPVVIIVFSINVGGVIISEASLSFLGFGLGTHRGRAPQPGSGRRRSRR